MRQHRRLAILSAALAAAGVASGQQKLANKFQVVGESGVSAQQLFRGQGNKVRGGLNRERNLLSTKTTPHTQVYILDKVENNPTQINGHPGEFSADPSLVAKLARQWRKPFDDLLEIND